MVSAGKIPIYPTLELWVALLSGDVFFQAPRSYWKSKRHWNEEKRQKKKQKWMARSENKMIGASENIKLQEKMWTAQEKSKRQMTKHQRTWPRIEIRCWWLHLIVLYCLCCFRSNDYGKEWAQTCSFWGFDVVPITSHLVISDVLLHSS